MSNFIIMTEGNSDVTAELAKRFGIDHTIPVSFSVNGESMFESPEGRDMDIKEFYQHVRNKEDIHTAAVIPEDVKNAMEKYLKEGTDILYLSFSSGLSNTYQNAMIAKMEIEEQNLPGKVMMVDTKMASLGEILLAHYCNEMRKAGKTIEETYEWAQENALKVSANFTVDDLFHLKRGGRVSAVTAIAGSALGIKPILKVDNDGKLQSDGKVRGRKAALDELIKRTMAGRVPQENEVIIVVHGDCEEDANYVRDAIIKETKLDKENVLVEYIGASIGCHAGAGTVATFVMSNGR